MSSAVVKDFFREIKRNLGRFFSILFIVAIGAAFFTGIRATGSDMVISSDVFFDEQNLMDIQVLGTMGLTEDDLSDIKNIQGVSDAIGAHTMDVLWADGNRELVLHTVERTDSLNQTRVTEGRLPQYPHECLLDAGIHFESEPQIGETITVYSGNSDDELSDYLNYDTFTIVGKGFLPYYTDNERGTSTVGDGSVDAFLVLDSGAYNMDIFTEIYVTVQGAKEELYLSDQYKSIVSPVYDKIEEMADTASKRRYDSVVSEATEKINDAKKEIADAKADIQDGKKKIADGLKELEDARIELEKGRRELEDGKRELDDNEKKLLEGQAEIDRARAEIEANKSEIMEGLSQMEAQEAALAASNIQIAETQAQIAATKAQLEEALRQIEEGEAQLNVNQAGITDGLQKIEEAKAEIAENERKLNEGQEEYDQSYADAMIEIADAEADIAKGETEIADGEKEIADAEKEINDLSMPKWYVLDREMIYGVESYHQNARRIDTIGDVFPVIFFLVAALVALTAMTRMVDEQRTQIGTMKALGYSSGVITGRYLGYAMLATIPGSILGVAFGGWFFPYFILISYGNAYPGLPYYLTPVNIPQSLLALIAAIASTGIATLFACGKQLRANPASLMRPEAPKNGNRTFLERIPFIWHHLGFSVKSTIRNLFRYKKRFIMTIIGVGGCTALLIVGFGISDSVLAIDTKQYGEVLKYDALVNIDTDEADEEVLSGYLSNHPKVSGFTYALNKSMDLVNGKSTVSTTLIVPEYEDELPAFIRLGNRITKEEYEYPKTGAAISEKAANTLGLNIGDRVILREDDFETDLEISLIVENYLQNYIYINNDTYREKFGEDPEYNASYIKFTNPLSTSGESEFGRELLKVKGFSGISFSTEANFTLKSMISTLNSVIWILILSAGLLAFIVLYNLNSINIMERRRELATLKVLGFYDTEVSMYVFRENIILSILGIGAGLLIGIGFHSFIVLTVETDFMMFGRNIAPLSFILSGLITLGFSVLVNLYMHFTLKKVDMVESLKSVE